ncbi:MAG: hypothetical protein JXJ17_18085 [Anaerolineae bacterium]|nr:hypothetical protein [Anaerolineae bacterium]
MEYQDTTVLRYPLKGRIKRFAYVMIGRLLTLLGIREVSGRRLKQALKHFRDKREFEDAYRQYENNDQLTDQQIDEIIAYQTHVYSTPRGSHFGENPVEETIQGRVIPMIESILTRDPAVRSVLNIGARYAYVDHVLACRHPEIAFTCVDFSQKFIEVNRDFQRDNIRFVDGYALELLEEGEIAGDIVFFSSTATLINNLELRRYMHILAKTTRYVVFNEPIDPPMNGAVIDPSRLPLDRQVSSSDRCLIHNYRAIVEEAGFEVLHYRLFPYEGPLKMREPDMHFLHLIAHNTTAT